MNVSPVDAIILGSGFGGSLLGLLLAKSRRSVVIVDRGCHPRFAIGESSTPLADRALADVAREFDADELWPLTRYGLWKKMLPDVTCGLKRGFSYFHQQPGQDLTEATVRDRQLLVTASADDHLSDTHWLRSDVDQYVFDCARSAGVIPFTDAQYKLRQIDSGWQIAVETRDQTFTVCSPFIVDATGQSSELLKSSGNRGLATELQTNTCAVFAHFDNVPKTEDLLAQRGYHVAEHPFHCDDAAVHHVFDTGWMWQLRFDDGTVSVGLVLNDPAAWMSISATDIWNAQLRRFPFLQQQFRDARIIRPSNQLVKTGRLQRLTARAAGANWAALPASAGFVDPLHSTGIAHTVYAVRRLAGVIRDQRIPSNSWLERYSEQLITELKLIDRLTAGCYASLPDFELWCAWSMLYFAAATTTERVRDCGDVLGPAFLLADDDEFTQLLIQAQSRLRNRPREFTSWLRGAIAPWNSVGLMNPDSRNLYHHTVAPIDIIPDPDDGSLANCSTPMTND